MRQKLYHDITWMNKTYILDLYFMLHDLCLSIFRHINIFCTKCQRVLLTLGMANIWDWWILESNFLNNINKPSHTQPSELVSSGDNSEKKANLQMLREWCSVEQSHFLFFSHIKQGLSSNNGKPHSYNTEMSINFLSSPNSLLRKA